MLRPRSSRDWRWAMVGLVLAALAVAGGWIAIARISSAPAEERQWVVDAIRSGEARALASDIVRLPDGTLKEDVYILATDPLTVFFLTETCCLDAYCGYEYAEGDPIEDPLRSRVGQATPLGDGWYRVCGN